MRKGTIHVSMKQDQFLSRQCPTCFLQCSSEYTCISVLTSTYSGYTYRVTLSSMHASTSYIRQNTKSQMVPFLTVGHILKIDSGEIFEGFNFIDRRFLPFHHRLQTVPESPEQSRIFSNCPSSQKALLQSYYWSQKTSRY